MAVVHPHRAQRVLLAGLRELEVLLARDDPLPRRHGTDHGAEHRHLLGDQSSICPYVSALTWPFVEWAGSQARVAAVVGRVASGGHPVAERGPALRWVHWAVVVWSGSVLRTKVHKSGVRVPAGPACVPGWGSDIRWTPRSVPGPYEPVGAVAFVWPKRGPRRAATSALPRRAGPLPPSPHRGTSGTHRLPGCPRSLPSYVATSSQERRCAAPYSSRIRRSARSPLV